MIIDAKTLKIVGTIHPWDQITEGRRFQMPWSSEKILEAIDEANKIGKEHYSSSEAWKEYQDNHTAEECDKCIDDVILQLTNDIMFIKMKEWQDPVLDDSTIEDFYAFSKDFKNTANYRIWKDGYKGFHEAIRQPVKIEYPKPLLNVEVEIINASRI